MNTNNKMPAQRWSASGRKKILYLITQSEFGGAQRYVFDLAENFKKEFDVFVAFGEQWKNGGLAGKLKEKNIKYYILKKIKREISPLNDFLAIFEIIKLIKKLQPDIVHLNSSKISILGSIAGFLYKSANKNRQIKIIYTVHGWVFNEPLISWKRIFYKYAEKLTAYLKDKIICVSKLDYELAANQLKIPEKKLTIIYHGINPINFLPREQARQKLKLKINNSTIVIGAIANLYKTKGLEYLIGAIRILVNYGFNVAAIVIGDGRERRNLEDLIAQANLKNKFILAGKINNAASILPAFDIYASSSLKEGFPYSIMEAMSACLPIVSTNVGGIPEMITNGKNGLLVEPKDPKKLAEKIKILTKDKELRNILGMKAKNDAGKKFSIGKMITKTKETYSV